MKKKTVKIVGQMEQVIFWRERLGTSNLQTTRSLESFYPGGLKHFSTENKVQSILVVADTLDSP